MSPYGGVPISTEFKSKDMWNYFLFVRLFRFHLNILLTTRTPYAMQSDVCTHGNSQRLQESLHAHTHSQSPGGKRHIARIFDFYLFSTKNRKDEKQFR